MLTSQIEKLKVGTVVQISRPGYGKVKRGAQFIDFDYSRTVQAEIVSTKRYSDYGWGGWAPRQDALILRPDSSRNDFGFLVRIIGACERTDGGDGNIVPVYGIVPPAAILAVASEYDAHWIPETARRAEVQRQLDEQRKVREKQEEKRREARGAMLIQSEARVEAIKESIPKNLRVLLGRRYEDVDLRYLRVNLEEGGTPDAPTYSVKDYGQVLISVNSLQALVELALLGKDA